MGGLFGVGLVHSSYVTLPYWPRNPMDARDEEWTGVVAASTAPRKYSENPIRSDDAEKAR